MKKILLLIPITIALAIFFYPTASNSNGTGSPGGKTDSPMDGQNCTGCHSSTLNTGVGTATITSNIPTNGYTIGSTYTITLSGTKANCSKFGFELTAENGTIKSGDFLITDNTTKLVNSNAVTHKSSGTSGNTTKSWEMGWTPTSSSIGNTTFYAALMFSNANGNNDSGDKIFTTSLMAEEAIVNTIHDYSTKNKFTFNTITKTIESIDNSEVLVYNMGGKLVLSSNKKHTSLSHLSKGIYIIKSENNSQKILIN